MNRPELTGVGLRVRSDSKEPRVDGTDVLNLVNVECLPPLSSSRVAPATALVDQDHFNARVCHPMAVRLNDPHDAPIGELQDASFSNGLAEARVRGLQRPCLPDDLLHSISSLLGRLMLPEANDNPAYGAECVVNVMVATDVTRELGLSVVEVRSRRAAVLGASMPPTAVNEYGNSLAWEHDVGPDGDWTGKNWVIDSISETATV